MQRTEWCGTVFQSQSMIWSSFWSLNKIWKINRFMNSKSKWRAVVALTRWPGYWRKSWVKVNVFIFYNQWLNTLLKYDGPVLANSLSSWSLNKFCIVWYVHSQNIANIVDAAYQIFIIASWFCVQYAAVLQTDGLYAETKQRTWRVKIQSTQWTVFLQLRKILATSFA